MILLKKEVVVQIEVVEAAEDPVVVVQIAVEEVVVVQISVVEVAVVQIAAEEVEGVEAEGVVKELTMEIIRISKQTQPLENAFRKAVL